MVELKQGLHRIDVELTTKQGGTFNYGHHVKGNTPSELIEEFFSTFKLFNHEKLRKFTIILKEI